MLKPAVMEEERQEMPPEGIAAVHLEDLAARMSQLNVDDTSSPSEVMTPGRRHRGTLKQRQLFVPHTALPPWSSN